jgi:hypothetical protein
MSPFAFAVTLGAQALALLMHGPAAAAPPAAAASSAGIYSCIAADGRRLTSDRPIAECSRSEQRVLNSDGSLRRVHPPSLTAEERAEKEAQERRVQAERLAHQDAIRRDRNLVARFPDEATHRKAREASLDTVRIAMKTSELRMRDLAAERRPLIEESEFFRGRSLPSKLRQQLDANDAAVDAQREAIQNQEAELDRINRLYDGELERLRRLWAGAVPGSLGPLQAASGARLAGAAKNDTKK